MNIISRKLISIITAVTAVIMLLPSSMTASAASAAYVRPQLSTKEVYSDLIKISVNNASAFPSGTTFRIYRAGRYLTGCSKSSADCIEIKDTGVTYFKPDTNYNFKVVPVLPSAGEQTNMASAIKVRTAPYTTYSVKKGTLLFKPKGSGMRSVSKTAAQIFVKGSLTNTKGTPLAGKKLTKSNIRFIYISEGMYEGYYIKAASAKRFSGAASGGLSSAEIKTLRQKVADYGASMAGGSYVYGGASYRRTDCSGLTMQAYAQVGITLDHSSYRQAQAGKAVSLNSMKTGDIICMNYGSHVALYIGNNMMVHALNPYDGIKIEPTSKLIYYHVDTVRRLIY